MTEKRGDQKPEQSILQKLLSKEPKTNVVFTAINELVIPSEIKDFMTEYAEWLGEKLKNDKEVKKNPMEHARNTVGYLIGAHYRQNQEVVNRWLNAVEGLELHLYSPPNL